MAKTETVNHEPRGRLPIWRAWASPPSFRAAYLFVGWFVGLVIALGIGPDYVVAVSVGGGLAAGLVGDWHWRRTRRPAEDWHQSRAQRRLGWVVVVLAVALAVAVTVF